MCYHAVVLLGEQQDSSYVGLVVVQRVQLGRRHVEGAVLGEAVVQGVVQGQQVHVVHGQVVGVVAALQVTHVDQRRPIEPRGSGATGHEAELRDDLDNNLENKRRQNIEKIRGHVTSLSSSPVVVNLVDDQELVTDLLLVEERVHEGDKHQQLLEALSERHNDGQLVRTPRRVVRCRCRRGVGWAWRLLGEAAVLA